MNYRNIDTKPYFSVTNTIIGGCRHTRVQIVMHQRMTDTLYMFCVINAPLKRPQHSFAHSPMLTTEDTV